MYCKHCYQKRVFLFQKSSFYMGLGPLVGAYSRDVLRDMIWFSTLWYQHSYLQQMFDNGQESFGICWLRSTTIQSNLGRCGLDCLCDLAGRLQTGQDYFIGVPTFFKHNIFSTAGVIQLRLADHFTAKFVILKH